MFILGPEIVAQRKNSIKTKTNTKIPTDDIPVDMNSNVIYNHHYDPNDPPVKSAACIIL